MDKWIDRQINEQTENGGMNIEIGECQTDRKVNKQTYILATERQTGRQTLI
jgi:hypothetical protein